MSTAETSNGTPTDRTQPNWASAQWISFLCAAIGLGTLVGLGLIHMGAADQHEADAANGQIFTSLLVGFIYWLSLPLGGTALLFFHYLVKTSWGVLLKRFIEASTRTLPLFIVIWAVIGVSLTFGKSATYWWVNPNISMIDETTTQAYDKVVAYEEDLKKYEESLKTNAANPLAVPAKPTAQDFFMYQKAKAIRHEVGDRKEETFGFLSVGGYFVVGAILFAVWGSFIYLQNKWSKEMDDPNKVLNNLDRLSNISGPGMILWSLAVTAGATQWVMSLEPSWASTMFPVIFAINTWLTCFAFCVALFLTLANKAPLKDLLRDKFQIDMGTLLLAFTLLWSYTSFSQMMLIWVGNLPEEIPFYLKRSMPTYGFWWIVSAGLIAFHFVLPFLLLLFRDVKLHPKKLRAVAIYLMVICAIDVIWWIEPAIPGHDGFGMYLLMDAGAIVGVGGLFGMYFIYNAKQRPIVAVNETFWLPEGHEHHEHH